MKTTLAGGYDTRTHEIAGEQDLSTKERLGEGIWETQGQVTTQGVSFKDMTVRLRHTCNSAVKRKGMQRRSQGH